MQVPSCHQPAEHQLPCPWRATVIRGKSSPLSHPVCSHSKEKSNRSTHEHDASINIMLYNECSSFKMMLRGRATSIYRVHRRVLVTCFSLRRLGNLRFVLKNIVFCKGQTCGAGNFGRYIAFGMIVNPQVNLVINEQKLGRKGVFKKLEIR